MNWLSVVLALIILMPGIKTEAKVNKRSDTPPHQREEKDPFQWLEEVESEKSLKWVREHNDASLKILKKGDFDTLFTELKKITTATDRIPVPEVIGGMVYNLWQDDKNTRGLWRRTTVEEFAKDKPAWETVLDLDELSKKEGKKWAWKAAICVTPDSVRCLLQLSDGGKDASYLREFDLKTKQFVENGFVVSEAKSNVSWKDSDTLIIGTDFGKGSMTSSGYPRIVKEWKRGTPLTSAKTLYEGKDSDVEVASVVSRKPTGTTTVLLRAMSFFEAELYALEKDGSTRRIVTPIDFDFQVLLGNKLVGSLRKEWKADGITLPSGTVIAFPIAGKGIKEAEIVLKPTAKQGVTGVVQSKDTVIISLLDNVKGRLIVAKNADKAWQLSSLAFPDNGNITIANSSEDSSIAYVTYESFLVPTSLFQFQTDNNAVPKSIRQLPERFDAKPFEAKQFEATSKDGTKIPYFVISKKNLTMDGNNPTLLYGYGGFEVSMNPRYLVSAGKAWLERGGTYVIANIRGGGEFGPKWHQAALKENRQKAFDDFAAVAQDLIQRKFTSPRRLGIHGGSNGGLLVGATYVQNPTLFNAVVCQVPLLDMLRYHKLLAGASWIGEYGDPEIPKEAAYIAKYSPYQNLKAGVTYPKVFFITSTKDDRVHPGHARKMAAKMESLGHPFFYFERIEGGHGGSVSPTDTAENLAFIYSYLFQQLVK